MTIQECKSVLFKLGLKHGVSPKLISERLLSKDDKEDMLNDLLSVQALECAVAVWKDDGMRNHIDGSGNPYSGRKTFPYSPQGCDEKSSQA